MSGASNLPETPPDGGQRPATAEGDSVAMPLGFYGIGSCELPKIVGYAVSSVKVALLTVDPGIR